MLRFDATGTAGRDGAPWPLRSAAAVGGRAVSIALRPLGGVLESAVDMAGAFERRAIDTMLESAELERVLIVAVDSPRIQTALQTVLSSDGARRLVDDFFDSGVFDRFVDRLLASEALWLLVDEIAQSPAVTAAISQQGLGFADQVGEQVRERSRRGDDLLERAVRRVIHRRRGEPEEDSTVGEETLVGDAPDLVAGTLIDVAPGDALAGR